MDNFKEKKSLYFIADIIYILKYMYPLNAATSDNDYTIIIIIGILGGIPGHPPLCMTHGIHGGVSFYILWISFLDTISIYTVSFFYFQ